MRTFVASSLIALASLLATNPAHAAECGTVSIAEMDWESASLLANVDAIILSSGYDCDVSLVPGDTMSTFATMNEVGEPEIAPELWINAYRDSFDAAVEAGRLRIAAKALSDGGVEGWWIPNYIAQEHPEIRTVEDALARPDLFPNPSDGSKGAVHNCPEGWNCRISTENLFKAFDGENKSFSLINSESGAELDASIAQAFETNTGWLGYYWAPTATLGKYDMVRLSFGVPHDQDEWNACTSQRDCEDPQPNAWPRSEVYTVMTDEIFRRGGEVPRYLSKRSWSNATVNMMLAWMVENRASIDEGARHFLENYGDVWEDWVTPAAAIKVRNHLANS